MIVIEELSAAGFAPYGVALGLAAGDDRRASEQPAWFSHPSDFWQEHEFRTGTEATQILWVIYRNADPAITQLEAHTMTEQALLPLTGEVIQIVAATGADGRPEPASIRAFRLRPGQGIVMSPGCWHATRIPQQPATCAMLTRSSTTRDLISHLSQGAPLAESRIAPVNIRLQVSLNEG
ncbi:ureidoglycolate hydrolase [Paracoccus aurantiacus]|uniref:Ureidoglycolate hydrolase n=1 Tax=Paracoccus aurantiacus TaxID=2599412 RepID=A0A5C6S8K4_9RHOB|nr:ureidoglycolate lyase [Paracoccus aurantiacus]TXB70694.1 ureidoglycolate hydrolase [Paracoccus aurantiacus]